MEQIFSSQDLTVIEQNGYASPLKENGQLFRRFMTWCEDQEEKRFLWLAIALMGNIGMVLPLTLVAILMGAGNNFALLLIVSAVNVPVLALNLAAQPPKVTLPVMFFAWLVNALIIIYSVIAFFWI